MSNPALPALPLCTPSRTRTGAISAIAAVASALMVSCANGAPAPEAVAPLVVPPAAAPAPEPAPQTKPSSSTQPTSSSNAPPPKDRPKFDAAAAEAAIRALDFDSCITDPSRQFQGYFQRTFGSDGRSPGGRLHMSFAAGGRPDPSISKCINALLDTLRVAEFSGSAMQIRGDFTIKNQTLTWKGPFTARTEASAESD